MSERLRTAAPQGATLAGGEQTRRRLGRLLGVAALRRQGARVTAAAWVVDHLEVEVALEGEEPVVLTVERARSGREGLVGCGELTLGYLGRALPVALEAVLRRVAPRALSGLRLEQLSALVAGDPEAGERRQPLPRRPEAEQRRFDEQSRLGGFGPSGVWRQFFALAERSRAQLDSLDYFNRSIFVQHSDAECVFLTPQTGVPMVELAAYPWGDRLRRIDWRGPGARREPDPGAPRLLTTDLTEADVILGLGKGKLDRALASLSTAALPEAEMIFCANTCVPVVSGEDTAAVVEGRRQRLPLPLLHLTTTPESMQGLLRALLVERRQAAEGAAGAPPPKTLNLIGYSEDPPLDELRGLLAAAGALVNEVLLPALSPARIDKLPRAGLQVLYPNELWRGHYDQLLYESPARALTPPAPCGPRATARWLAEIAGALSLEVDAEAIVEARWAPLAEPWEALSLRARRHRLGLVVSQEEQETLTDPEKTWGFPLVSLLGEMGFQVVTLVGLGDEEGPSPATLDGAVELVPFRSPEELWAALGGAGLSAVLSEHFYDRRLTERGLASFSLQHLELGLEGALRSLRRLVELCELPFFSRYGRHLATGAARRAGLTHPLG